MPLLKDLGVGCILWSPLARGFLTKDINAITTRTQKDQWLWVNGDSEVDTFLATINRRVKETAEKRGISMEGCTRRYSHTRGLGATAYRNFHLNFNPKTPSSSCIPLMGVSSCYISYG